MKYTEAQEFRLINLNWNRAAYIDNVIQDRRQLTKHEIEEKWERINIQNAYASLFNGDICKNPEELEKLLTIIENSLTPRMIEEIDKYVKCSK